MTEVHVEIPSKDEKKLACMVRGLAFSYESQRAVGGVSLDKNGFLHFKIQRDYRAKKFTADVDYYFGRHGVKVTP